jgi:hypothetical protein
MPASILPYDKVLQDGEEVDFAVVRFTGFHSNILVREQYCVNPWCSCADAVLTFIELSEEGKPINNWFEIRLDLSIWRVTERKVLNKMIKADRMIKEFMESIDEVKEKLLSHFIKAKEYGKKHYLDYIPDSTVKMIFDGKMLGYSEVFGNAGTDRFSFEMDGTAKWFFDDQYCSNPKCLCNEVVLTFFKTDSSKAATREAEFAIRMSLKDFKYDVEFNKCDANRIPDIIKYLKTNRPEVFDILKRRYNEIKSASREINIKSGFQEKKEEQSKTKVGRNDPCPCGSGKKYKKCCST